MTRRRLAAAAAGVAAAWLLAGCAGSSPQPAPPPPPDELPPLVGSGQAGQIVPNGLRIPSLGIDQHQTWLALGIQGQCQGGQLIGPKQCDNGGRYVEITPPGTQDEIEVPPLMQEQRLGWYCPNGLPDCGSPAPGQVGPAVVVGHVNRAGHLGIFAKLAQIKKGALVEVSRADNTVAVFTVANVVKIDKDKFPTAEVFGNTDKPELRLITCGDGSGSDLETLPDGTHSYRNQTIVYADLTDIKTPTPARGTRS